MLKAPIPKNEKERLNTLKELKILDTPAEKHYDMITKMAIDLFNVPISTVTLVDSNREWFKSCQGLPAKEGERAISFCGHAMLSDGIFIIPDAKEDKRFKDNPIVTGEPFIRFYAGVPLSASNGDKIGTFCIKDRKSRDLNQKEKRFLKNLATWVEVEINSRNLSLAQDKVKESEKVLEDRVAELDRLNKVMIGREIRMVKLKEKISKLEAQLAKKISKK